MGVEDAGETGLCRRGRDEPGRRASARRAGARVDGAVDPCPQAEEHSAFPVERRPNDFTLGAVGHWHTREGVDDIEELDVRGRVEPVALPALGPQRPYARRRPGCDNRRLTVDERGQMPAGDVVEAAAGDEHCAQPVEVAIDRASRLEEPDQVARPPGDDVGPGRSQLLDSGGRVHVQRRHARLAAAEHELPVRQVWARRENAHEDVVPGDAGQLEPTPAQLGQALDVLGRRPDGEAVVDVPVKGLVHGVDEALVHGPLPAPELGPEHPGDEADARELLDALFVGPEHDRRRIDDVVEGRQRQLVEVVPSLHAPLADARLVEANLVVGRVRIDVLRQVAAQGPILSFLDPRRLAPLPRHSETLSTGLTCGKNQFECQSQ